MGSAWWPLLLPGLAGLLWAAAAASAGKYSREANEGARNGGPPAEFRLVRLNQVWEKAQRQLPHLSAVRLAELHSDLRLQEKDELRWKKLKAEGLDEDGEKEAKLRRDLDDSHKNVISLAEEESPFKEELLHNKHSELKEKLHSINQGFERLRRVSHQGYDSTSEFEEPRVIDLWDMAKSTNFTQEELESLREELKHFEAKVEKHHHYQKQLEISHQKLKHVEGMGDDEHLSKHKEKYAMLQEKTKDLGYKVKKHLQDLSGRISRGFQHNEL
ncbi:alpha-2-macroglobulin receptor-associated protein isoform X3 [Pogona vitticeps]